MATSLTISVIAFACIFGGTLLAMLFRTRLPEHHVSSDAKDVVKLGIGTIATLSALAVGLLIASAKGNFDTINSELKQGGSRIVLLDRTMAKYGPETAEARQLLRDIVASSIQRAWPEEKIRPANAVDAEAGFETLEDKLLQLQPRSDTQRWLQSRALQISGEIIEARWLLAEQVGQSALPMPFLVILIFWFTIIFTSFGLLSPRNPTVIAVLLVCTLSVSGSLFLIQEMDRPYEGFIKVSSAPLRNALAHLGK